MNNIAQIDKLIYSPSKASRTLGFKIMKQKDQEQYQIWKEYEKFCSHTIYNKSLELQDLPMVDELKISNTSSDVIFNNLNLLKNLTRLRIYGCDLNGKLPQSVTKLELLEKLFITECEITECDNIGKLKNLNQLSLSQNNLNKIPMGVFELNNLRCLILSSNKISKIPKEIERLENLRDLQMRNNLITEINDELCKLSKLEHVTLRANKITTVNKNVKNMKALVSLNLKYNKIKYIPSSLSDHFINKHIYVIVNPIT